MSASTDPGYMTNMQADDPAARPADLIAAYAVGAEALRSAVTGMSGIQLTARPVPGRWSTLEVVAHIADSEIYFGERILRTLAMDKPLLVSVDEGPYNSRLRYQELDVADELALVAAIRRRVGNVLVQQPADAWTRPAVHTDTGVVIVRQLVLQATRHLRHHLPFIAEKRAALGGTA